MKISKDEVYVLLQPKHAITSIILIKDEFPLNEKMHKNLDSLASISDIMFIFSDRHYSGSKSIDKFKFSSLYNACCFIDSENSLPKTLFKLLEYDVNVFGSHVSFNIMNSKVYDNEIPELLTKNIITISQSSSVNPIFITERLCSEVLFDFYGRLEDEKDVETVDNNSFSGFFKKNKEKKIINKDNSHAFSCYQSNSLSMLFKKGVIDKLIDYVNTTTLTEPSKLFDITSFDEDNDFSYLLPSMCKYLEIDTLNGNVETFNIGKL